LVKLESFSGQSSRAFGSRITHHVSRPQPCRRNTN
jgi:hypothetical protein